LERELYKDFFSEARFATFLAKLYNVSPHFEPMKYTLETFLENTREHGLAIALREDVAATQLRHPWLANMYSALLVMPFLKFDRYSGQRQY